LANYVIEQGENPVDIQDFDEFFLFGGLIKSKAVWECSLNIGGRYHQKLNIMRETNRKQVQ